MLNVRMTLWWKERKDISLICFSCRRKVLGLHRKKKTEPRVSRWKSPLTVMCLCVHCRDTLPVFLFARTFLCRVPEASMFDSVLHTLILIWDLISRIGSQCKEMRRQTRDQLGLGQPQSLTHTCHRERWWCEVAWDLTQGQATLPQLQVGSKKDGKHAHYQSTVSIAWHLLGISSFAKPTWYLKVETIMTRYIGRLTGSYHGLWFL